MTTLRPLPRLSLLTNEIVVLKLQNEEPTAKTSSNLVRLLHRQVVLGPIAKPAMARPAAMHKALSMSWGYQCSDTERPEGMACPMLAGSMSIDSKTTARMTTLQRVARSQKLFWPHPGGGCVG